MQDIVIIGSGGHAKVIVDIVEKEGKFNIVGFIDDFKKIGDDFLGYKIIGSIDNFFSNCQHGIAKGIIAIGENWDRYSVAKKVKTFQPNFKFVTAVHPSSVIGKNVKIGNGTVIMAGAICNTDVVIGEHCIINTATTLDHECEIANYVSLSPSTTLAGKVRVGNFSFSGTGASIIHEIAIGQHSLIGAGSLVLKDIKDYEVWFGSPACFIKLRRTNDKILS